jgi:DNA repair exonuclease SbcCD ATPase subunit
LGGPVASFGLHPPTEDDLNK